MFETSESGRWPQCSPGWFFLRPYRTLRSRIAARRDLAKHQRYKTAGEHPVWNWLQTWLLGKLIIFAQYGPRGASRSFAGGKFISTSTQCKFVWTTPVQAVKVTAISNSNITLLRYDTLHNPVLESPVRPTWCAAGPAQGPAAQF